MSADAWTNAGMGILAIMLVFGLFTWLLYRTRRTHTRRFGGIHWLEVLRGRRTRIERDRKKRR